jgi:pyrroloquinoline quinone biosynthesis protein D
MARLTEARRVINDTRVFSLSDRVSIQQLGGGEGAVVLFIDTGQLYTCNDTTAAFLSVVDGKRTFVQIVADLEHRFEVSREELCEDLTTLASQLIEERIIR